MDSEESELTTRRRVLSGVALLGIDGFASGATAREGDRQRHRIVLNSPASVPVDYRFAVTGDVRKTRDTGGVFSRSVVTKDADDVVGSQDGFGGTTVRGRTQGGVDAYVFAGDLVGFESTNCSEFNVWIDGSKRSACALNREHGDSGPSLERSLPRSDVTVAPDTTVLFEAALDYSGGRTTTRWFVDGTRQYPPDTFYAQLDRNGKRVRTNTFESTGTHRVRVEVYEGDLSIEETADPIAATGWTVRVESGGNRPPVVDKVTPRSDTVRVERNVTARREFVVEAVDSDSELDRAIWWVSQGDRVTDASGLNGRRDTARSVHDPDPGLPFGAWAVDEHGAMSAHAWWDIEEK